MGCAIRYRRDRLLRDAGPAEGMVGMAIAAMRGFPKGVAMMNRQNRWVWLVAMFVAGFCVGVPSFAADQKEDKTGSISPQDQEFVNQAGVINKAEIELGKMAQSQASNSEVKAFAKKMVEDHGKAGKELEQLVRQEKGTMPKDLDQTHKDLKDKLSKLSGAEFDKQYMEAMVKGHQQAVSLFESESKSETAIGKWAGQTVATLHQHHDEASRVAKEVGASAASGEQK